MFGLKTVKKALAFGAKTVGNAMTFGSKVAGKVGQIAGGVSSGVANAYDVLSNAPVIGDAVKTFAPHVQAVIKGANQVSQTANRVKGVLDLAGAASGAYRNSLERAPQG